MTTDFLQFDSVQKAFTEDAASIPVGLLGAYNTAVSPADNIIQISTADGPVKIIDQQGVGAGLPVAIFQLLGGSTGSATLLAVQGNQGAAFGAGAGVYLNDLNPLASGTGSIGKITFPFNSGYSNVWAASDDTNTKAAMDSGGVHLSGGPGALTWQNQSNLDIGVVDLSITRSAASKYLLDTATHTTYVQFGGVTNAFAALNNATLNDASGIGLLCRLADDSDNAGLQGSRFLAMGTGGGGGVFAIRTGGVDQLFIDGTGVYVQSTAIHAWSASGNALGAVDVVMKRPGAGTLEIDLDPGSGRTQAVAWSFTGVNNDTTMVLTCRIAGVETQKRVTRDPITNALFAV